MDGAAIDPTIESLTERSASSDSAACNSLMTDSRTSINGRS